MCFPYALKHDILAIQTYFCLFWILFFDHVVLGCSFKRKYLCSKNKLHTHSCVAKWPRENEFPWSVCMCKWWGPELVLCPIARLCLASREHAAMLLVLLTFHGNVRMCLAVLARNSCVQGFVWLFKISCIEIHVGCAEVWAKYWLHFWGRVLNCVILQFLRTGHKCFALQWQELYSHLFSDLYVFEQILLLKDMWKMKESI